MFIEKDLKQLGIEIIDKVEDEKIAKIAGKVSMKLVETFPKSEINYLEIYRTLISTPMYYAKISGKISEVNYYYKNSTIYISKDIEVEEVNEYVFHECIHRIQEHRDKKGNLTRMGICEINEISVKATALNEAAIEYITSRALQNPEKRVTIYGITLPTRTEYYSIITNLIGQIAYLIGDEILVNSTINSNEDFKIEIIDNFGEETYDYLEKSFNEILRIKNNIQELQDEEKEENIDKISENIQIIKNLYIQTQNEIFTAYFEQQFKRIETLEDVSIFRKTLYTYRNTIGTTQGYDVFNYYCIDIDNRVKEKAEQIKKSNALTVINDNKFIRFLKKIKKLFINPQNEYNK